jgi:tRNA(fMet)-specific endonuclease VapC
MFLLDTDHLGIIQDRVQPECQRLLDRIGQFPATAFYVSIVSFHEQVVGWNSYLNRARTITGMVSAYRMFQDILVDFVAMQVLPFDDVAESGWAGAESPRSVKGSGFVTDYTTCRGDWGNRMLGLEAFPMHRYN